MKPPQPLNPEPFLTLFTPTFQRPEGLAKCLASVSAQTAAAEVQHVVAVDHVGHGVGVGLFGNVKRYAQTFLGRYVNILCDDDYLPDETAVAQLQAFAQKHHDPPVMVVGVRKGRVEFPLCPPDGEPFCGLVDLTSFVVRRDIFAAHVADYREVYEGDYWHAKAMYDAGVRFTYFPFLWAIGAQSNGRPEA